jgi:hypothetical protein
MDFYEQRVKHPYPLVNSNFFPKNTSPAPWILLLRSILVTDILSSGMEPWLEVSGPLPLAQPRNREELQFMISSWWW